jgi:hypothetical protein
VADFPTSPKPSYPIEESAAMPDVAVSTHRDGTEQRRYKGAGTGRTFKLPYGSTLPITNTERLLLMAHWTGQRGIMDSFNFVHPERGETIVCRYAEKPTFNHTGYNCYEGSVSLQEVPA